MTNWPGPRLTRRAGETRVDTRRRGPADRAVLAYRSVQAGDGPCWAQLACSAAACAPGFARYTRITAYIRLRAFRTLPAVAASPYLSRCAGDVLA